MWRHEADHDRTRPTGRATDQASEPVQRSALERYRMYGRFYERYWSRLFGMTQADMTRFAETMRVSGQAMTLTELACDVIRARLRQGPQLQSGPAPDGGMPDCLVRQWDPAANWHQGDRAIVIVSSPTPGRNYAPRISEVIHVADNRIVIDIDGIAASQVYALGTDAYAGENPDAGAEMLGIGERFDESAQTDFVLWRYGSHVVGRLLHALDMDPRFIELEGLFFSSDLVTTPSDSAMRRLAETMFEQSSGPLRIDDVISVLAPTSPMPVATRFGLAQSLDQRADLFENIGTRSHPRWALVAPPPRTFTAHQAVYDPETYEVLCIPGEDIPPDVAQRLWQTGLLHAAIEAPQRAPEAVGAGQDAAPEADTLPHHTSGSDRADRKRGRRPEAWFLPRWLRPARS